MLEVINLTKKYDNFPVVDNISFKVSPGKIFGLLGPNGAGKTTTMRMILNIIRPTSGKILFNGSQLLSNVYNSVGYLPEERGLYKKSKVINLILHFALLKGMQNNIAKVQTIKWLEQLNIYSLAEKKVEELSKGNQQKVQFIIAIIHDPQIIILDEPFTGFDPINQHEIKDIILNLAKSGKNLILSTHQLDIAEKLCTDIFLINRGKGICNGNIYDIKKYFGNQHIKLIFDEDNDPLKDNPDILNYKKLNNVYEIKLKEAVKPSYFLKSIASKTTINHFSIIEPSLNQIFIDLVKRNSEPSI